MYMLHHLSFAVREMKRSARFYDATLRALGYRRVESAEDFAGWGVEAGSDRFAIKLRKRGVRIPGPGFHVAFAAPSHKAVDAFYRAALKHGGTDNGGSGPCPEYGPHYYAAFVFDPDGYAIEAVTTFIFDADGRKVRPILA